MNRKHWKRSKYWIPAFSPFPSSFSNAFFFRVIKSVDCLVKSIPITRRQILDSSKLKEFADDNFKFDENGKKLSKQVKNTVGKGEIARYEQFLLFPQCFQKASFQGASKGVIVREWVKKQFQFQYERALPVLRECNRLRPKQVIPVLQAAKICYEHLHKVRNQSYRLVCLAQSKAGEMHLHE